MNPYEPIEAGMKPKPFNWYLLLMWLVIIGVVVGAVAFLIFSAAVDGGQSVKEAAIETLIAMGFIGVAGGIVSGVFSLVLYLADKADEFADKYKDEP